MKHCPLYVGKCSLIYVLNHKKILYYWYTNTGKKIQINKHLRKFPGKRVKPAIINVNVTKWRTKLNEHDAQSTAKLFKHLR